MTRLEWQKLIHALTGNGPGRGGARTTARKQKESEDQAANAAERFIAQHFFVECQKRIRRLRLQAHFTHGLVPYLGVEKTIGQIDYQIDQQDRNTND